MPRSLPFADSSFDYVVSAIGVMFTADHDRAAGELVRVCKPGGTIGLANWTAEGFIGRLLKTVSAHVPPPPVALPPTRWGNEDVVRELLGDAVTDVSSRTHVVTQRFLSPEAFADFMLTYYGPTYTAARTAGRAGPSGVPRATSSRWPTTRTGRPTAHSWPTGSTA